MFDNFGPYHIARLAAAARSCDLLGIEVASASAEYAWQPTESVPFNRKTLFHVNEGDKKTPQALEERLEEALAGHGTEVLAIPGWSGYHALIALRVALRRGIPIILMSESQEIDFPRARLKEWIKRRYLGLCQAALVGGAPHRAYLVKLGMAGDRIFQGYDIVDNAYFAGRADEARQNAEALRSRLGLPARFFLASARFIEKKNLLRLIRAYASYRQSAVAKAADCRGCLDLVLLGDGELRPQLEALATELGVQKFVHMPGFKQYADLPNYYGLASAFIHASTSEQWGLVVNEAMASGLPVLVSRRCGCSADLVRDGINGFAFDPYDEAGMTALMLKMGADECDLAAMGQSGRELIADWTPETFAEGLVEAASAARSARPVKWGFVDRTILRTLVSLHA
jgi:glycosyltransferase involved in cell wall biosynthesis